MILQQKSLLQTGIAILLFKDGHKEMVPLFSNKPVEEANEIAIGIEDCVKVEDTFVTNTYLDVNLLEDIDSFVEERGFLPQDLIGQLRSGFSYIYNSLEFNGYPANLYYN